MQSGDIEDDGFGERMMLFTTYESSPLDLASLADALPSHTRNNDELYLTRL